MHILINQMRLVSVHLIALVVELDKVVEFEIRAAQEVEVRHLTFLIEEQIERFKSLLNNQIRRFTCHGKCLG